MKRPKASVFVQAVVFWMIALKIEGQKQLPLSVGEVAHHFGVSRSTVIDWILRYNGKLGLVAWRDEDDARGKYFLHFSDHVMRDESWLEFEQAHYEVNAYLLWKQLR